MDIQATLEKCRAELKRQQKMEAKATPGPWEEVTVLDIWRKGPIVSDGDGNDYAIVCFSRNLNPARLKVMEELLDNAAGFADEPSLKLAAALLGMEVEQ